MGQMVQVPDLSGSYPKIICDQVAGGAVATFDTQTILGGNIPQTFRHLRALLLLRDDSVGTGLTTAVIRLNNDSGANYDSQGMNGNAATGLPFEAFAQTGFASLAFEVPNGIAAGLFAESAIDIPSYVGTTANKTVLCFSGAKTGTTTGLMNVRTATGFWRSSSAITRISVLPGLGSNFIAGCQFTLYGFS